MAQHLSAKGQVRLKLHTLCLFYMPFYNCVLEVLILFQNECLNYKQSFNLVS